MLKKLELTDKIAYQCAMTVFYIILMQSLVEESVSENY